MTCLFAYKLTHDTGFAPNPFHGFCTLATCKPGIRKTKRVGDWIAGFTSSTLNGDAVGHERLVYLLQICEKLRFDTYHVDPRFERKIPRQASVDCVDTVGDNIYGRRNGAVFQVPNRFHGAEAIAKDTSGEFVLIGRRFAYFGAAPLVIPGKVRPQLPVGMSRYGIRTRDADLAQAFVDFVFANGAGIRARPTSWRTGDTSWQAWG
jgi:hypothetical protein